MPLQAGAELGHYALIEKIGEGGMGVVWRARDRKLDREVALKVLPEARADDPEWLERLTREARAAAALEHPNVVGIHAIEEAEGVRFLALELVRGTSLAERIPPGGLPLAALVGLGSGVAAALAAAHRRGLTHCDLKPRNVMVDESGQARVLDFGLASFQPVEPASVSPDSPTAPYPPLPLVGGGTPCYMSPERLRGAPPDPRADVWALGALLHEMACGEPPFRGATPADLVAAVLREAPEPVARRRPDLPAEFGTVVAACLEKDLARRTISAEDVGRALLRLPADGVPQRRVAVLPFVDMSREQDQGWLCDGLAEEILLALRGLPGLRVISRAMAFSARSAAGPRPDLRDLGRGLGASVPLDGSVRRAGPRVRVAVELCDVEDGSQLWAFRHEADLDDVFALQDEIARQVAEALEVRLAAGPRSGTTELRAWELYHRARRQYYRYSRHAVEAAKRLFEQALEADPRFARAWAGLADCGFFLYLYVRRDTHTLRDAREASRRALELEPALPEAHASRGMGLSLDGRHAEAERAFEQAVRLDPDLFEAHYFRARDAFAQGRLSDAAREWEAAARVRPEDFQSPLLVAQVYEALARPVDATAARRRGVALAEAQAAREPEDARALYMAANGLVALGERERGLALAERAVALEPGDPMLLYNVGCILALAAEPERAIDCLARAVAGGLRQRGWLEHDTNLDSLRADPRFAALVESLPEEA
ncbi:MAG: protein kinase [Vicinamibacteria bacterium]|nr:protein kinase [Vicinamibacteria bacterium]